MITDAWKGKTRTATLLFEQVDEELLAGDSYEKQVMDILGHYPSSTPQDQPDMFTNLVHAMRHLTYPKLAFVFHQVASDHETRQRVLDAVPLLRTDAGLHLMSTIVREKRSGEVSSGVLDSWYSSLSLYKNPTRSMIASAFVRTSLSPFQLCSWLLLHRCCPPCRCSLTKPCQGMRPCWASRP